MENQEPKEDCSQDDSHPEVGPSVCQSRHSIDSDTDEAPHMLTGGPEESGYRPDMVTGSPEVIRHRSHMVTVSQEKIPYCSHGTSSGNQKKARCTSQPQFRSENAPATIEADQTLLVLQQLATNNNSVNFNNNINRISKLLKSLATIMPTFDGKLEKFKLFEDLFHTGLKIKN